MMTQSVLSLQPLPATSWRSMSSRMVALPSRGATTMSTLSARSKAQWGDESYSDFVLIFNRAAQSAFITYLLIDRNQGHTANIFPKTNSMFMNRLKDIVEYRIVSLNNHVYILGGLHLESQSVLSYCHRFDPYNCQWKSISAMNKGRFRFATAVMSDCIYVSGGIVRDGRMTSSTERYDPATDSWTELRAMPEPRIDHCMCTSRSNLYVSGGQGNNKTTLSSSWFWQYDPQSDYWWTGRSNTMLPTGRWNHCMKEHRGVIYCVGGMTVRRIHRRYEDCYDDTMCYIDSSMIRAESGMNGKWKYKDLPTVHQPRAHAGLFTLGHRLYLVGGNRDGKSVNTIEYYSPPRKKWVQCFYLGSGDYSAVDCVVVRVPRHNQHFNHLTNALHKKFVFW